MTGCSSLLISFFLVSPGSLVAIESSIIITDHCHRMSRLCSHPQSLYPLPFCLLSILFLLFGHCLSLQ